MKATLTTPSEPDTLGCDPGEKYRLYEVYVLLLGLLQIKCLLPFPLIFGTAC